MVAREPPLFRQEYRFLERSQPIWQQVVVFRQEQDSSVQPNYRCEGCVDVDTAPGFTHACMRACTLVVRLDALQDILFKAFTSIYLENTLSTEVLTSTLVSLHVC